MKKLALILNLVFSISSVFSQEKIQKNAGYVQLLGNGLLVSVNYERQIFSEPKLGVHFGIGFYGKPTFPTIPIGLNYLLKINKSRTYVEAGIGATYTKAHVEITNLATGKNSVYDPNNRLNIVPSIGVRMLSKKTTFFRFAISPIINKDAFIPFLGFSFGFRA